MDLTLEIMIDEDLIWTPSSFDKTYVDLPEYDFCVYLFILPQNVYNFIRIGESFNMLKL
jgi:hypothetical protein